MARRIAIVGAGPAGLATAAFLARDGHLVTIIERFATPRPIGAGLMLQPTGLACLAALGCDEEIIRGGRRIDAIFGATASGRTIFDVAYARLAPHLFGLGVQRANLFDALHAAANRHGAQFTTGTEISSTQLVGGGRLVHDMSGHEHGPFDLVIDASGTRSSLRNTHGAVRMDRPYPYGALWALVDLPEDWPDPDRLTQRYDGCSIMAGVLPVGANPANGNQRAAFFWSLPAAAIATWKASGLATWKKTVERLWPQLQPLLAQLSAPENLTFANYADVVMRSWAEERLLFLGDAAHATSPQLGQGVNLAMIDAITIAESLRLSDGDVGQALDRFQRSRRRHIRFHQRASHWMTPFFQSDSRVAGAIRDATFGPMHRLPFVSTLMAQTLAGVKTGPFSRLDPGQWHARYALRPGGQPGGRPAVPSSRPKE